MANLAIKSENHKQLMLLPPSYEELVPTTHPVRVVDAIINKLDIKEIENSYKGGGNSCFNPKFMYLCTHILRDGAVVARRAHNPKVRGSSPLPATDADFSVFLLESPFSFTAKSLEIQRIRLKKLL